MTVSSIFFVSSDEMISAPSSPKCVSLVRWLAGKGRIAEARKVLRSLRSDSQVDAALEEMQKDALAAAREKRSVWELVGSQVVRMELKLGGCTFILTYRTPPKCPHDQILR